MTTERYDCRIRSSMDSLWSVLMDEVEHPEEYSNTITDVEVLERFHDGILRCLSVPDAKVREKVIFDYERRRIDSSLVGHPSLVCHISKQILPGNEAGELILRSTLEWKSTDESVDQMIRRNIADFVKDEQEKVKRRVENVTQSEQA